MPRKLSKKQSEYLKHRKKVEDFLEFIRNDPDANLKVRDLMKKKYPALTEEET